MNKVVTKIFCFCFSFIFYGQQNLVYNGDFEEYSACPQSESSPSQNPKEIEKCVGWKTPTYGTSDYFNMCSQNPTVSVPINLGGEQLPFNGDGYLGGYVNAYTGGGGTDGYSGIMWWEYIQGQTISTLESGKIYTFSVEISLAEYSDLMINEIGVYFSDFPISSQNSKNLTVEPQIKFHNPSFFSDTLNWIHLEASFIAAGGEKYITIGNFGDSVTTDTLRRYNYEPFISNPYVTYIYFDNVKLTEFYISDTIFNLFTPNIFTPNDDGVNDVWQFYDKNDDKTISIFNRWGSLIVQGKSKGFIWDGKSREGIQCLDGVYFFRVHETNENGFIQLIR